MRLVRLRHQMLIAMGIAGPACWTGAPPAPPPTPPPAPKVSTHFEADSCPRDTLPETVCGERRETARACGTRASNLGTVEESKLYLTTEDTDNPGVTYKEFAFDRDATQTYRETIDDPTTKNSYCCYSQCTRMIVGAADPVTPPAGASFGTHCMPAPPNGTSKPSKEDKSCPEGVMLEGGMRPYSSTEEGECCYTTPVRHIMHTIPGRALRVDGVPHVADIAPDARAAWSIAISPSLDLDATTRAQLATSWLEIAQLEHASIAAFAALALRLLAAAAPVELIAAAHEAALDEVRHAQIAFELASAYRGERVGPGRFEAARRAPVDGELRALAIETFLDGCIGETAAAHHAEVASSLAQDPQVATALAAIAEDEKRHAALAWSIVAWCVRQGAVSVAELAAIAATAGSADATPITRDDLACHGVLGETASIALRDDVVREVVEPCLAALAA
jgi:hypothetical protein